MQQKKEIKFEKEEAKTVSIDEAIEYFSKE
jgi:hypothetical protein